MRKAATIAAICSLLLLPGLTGCGSSMDEEWDLDVYFNYSINMDTGQDSLEVVGYVNKIVDRSSWLFLSRSSMQTLRPQRDCQISVYGNELQESDPDGVYRAVDWYGDIFSEDVYEISLNTPEGKNFSFTGRFFNVLTERIEYPDTIQVGQAIDVQPVIDDYRAHVYLAKLVAGEEVWYADAQDYLVPEVLAGEHMRFVSVMFAEDRDVHYDENDYERSATCTVLHNYYLRKDVYVAP